MAYNYESFVTSKQAINDFRHFCTDLNKLHCGCCEAFHSKNQLPFHCAIRYLFLPNTRDPTSKKLDNEFNAPHKAIKKFREFCDIIRNKKHDCKNCRYCGEYAFRYECAIRFFFERNRLGEFMEIPERKEDER